MHQTSNRNASNTLPGFSGVVVARSPLPSKQRAGQARSPAGREMRSESDSSQERLRDHASEVGAGARSDHDQRDHQGHEAAATAPRTFLDEIRRQDARSD